MTTPRFHLQAFPENEDRAAHVRAMVATIGLAPSFIADAIDIEPALFNHYCAGTDRAPNYVVITLLSIAQAMETKRASMKGESLLSARAFLPPVKTQPGESNTQARANHLQSLVIALGLPPHMVAYPLEIDPELFLQYCKGTQRIPNCVLVACTTIIKALAVNFHQHQRGLTH